MTDARYRLGPIRVQPTFVLRNLGYNDNVFGATDDDLAVDDWTATVGAGVQAWLPFGPKMVFGSTLRPEYTWYKDNDELSRMGGYYDVAAYGFFNRLRLEARALTEDTQTIVSSELQATTRRETAGFSGRAEVEIFRRLAVFAGADQRSFEHENPDIEGLDYDVTRLDRDDSAMRAGVRYAWRSWFDVSAMVEKTETEFDLNPQLRDNESEAVLVGVHYDRPQFFVNLVGGQRDGTPLNGSSFPEYSTWSGSYFMQYRLTAP
ncbi:MAG: hypothetical protein LC732_11190, partial [Acidobacteria bacterium]|nr:hypothetical protein [Acidobacteriota bacterium]